MAQDRPTLPPNSISAGADGKFEAAPDTAVVDFNIAVQEENSHTAYDRASQQAEQVRQILAPIASTLRLHRSVRFRFSRCMTTRRRSGN